MSAVKNFIFQRVEIIFIVQGQTEPQQCQHVRAEKMPELSAEQTCVHRYKTLRVKCFIFSDLLVCEAENVHVEKIVLKSKVCAVGVCTKLCSNVMCYEHYFVRPHGAQRLCIKRSAA